MHEKYLAFQYNNVALLAWKYSSGLAQDWFLQYISKGNTVVLCYVIDIHLI